MNIQHLLEGNLTLMDIFLRQEIKV